MDVLAKEPLLRHAQGPYQGRLCFPCGCGVVFTNITRSQLDHAGLRDLFPPGKALCRDELETLRQSNDDSAFRRRLKEFMPADFPCDPLTLEQCRTLHGVIHPEVVVKVKTVAPATPPALSGLPVDTRALEVLDRKQEQIARFIGEGHRVVAGVAGSGKTILLLARARLLAMRDPEKRILVLCYNRSLAAYLHAHLGGLSGSRNIEVCPFRTWAEGQTGLSWNRHEEEFEHYEQRLTEVILDRTTSWPEDRKYDAVLIDEAPDFYPEWLRVCAGVVKGGADGDLLIVVDGAQSVYGRPSSFTWKSLGIHAQGRTRTLSTNYRNTKQIIEFAWIVAQPLEEDSEDARAHVRVRPSHVTRTGPVPSYRACRTAREERDLVVQLVVEFKKQGIPEQDIGILYARREAKRIEELFASLQACGNVCWVTNEADPAARHQFVSRPGVRLCTIHSAKGLQFPVVILTAVDQLPNPMSSDEEADRNLFYVGLTRAEHQLVLTWSGRSKFTELVLQSNRAVPLSPTEVQSQMVPAGGAAELGR